MRGAVLKRDHRTAERLDVDLPATIREFGSPKRFDVRVIDLSIKGFRCSTHLMLRIGQPISIAIPGFAPLQARVAWQENARYGCAFDTSLHMAVLDHIAARFRKV